MRVAILAVAGVKLNEGIDVEEPSGIIFPRSLHFSHHWPRPVGPPVDRSRYTPNVSGDTPRAPRWPMPLSDRIEPPQVASGHLLK